MDILLGSFLGATLKGYDDIIDLNITLSTQFKEILKAIIISLFTLLANNDFSFSFTTLLSLGASELNKANDDPFWKSLLATSILCSILFFGYEGNVILRSIFLFIFVIAIYLEGKIITEERSVRKTVSKLIFMAFIIFFLKSTFIQGLYKDIKFFNKLVSFALGYQLISLLNTYLFNEVVEEFEEPVKHDERTARKASKNDAIEAA